MLKRLKAIVEYSKGTSNVWSDTVRPITDGVLVFALDNGVFKLGDGQTLYKDLPILFTLTELLNTTSAGSNIFIEPTVEMEGEIVIAQDGMLINSGIKLVDFLEDLDDLDIVNENQDTALLGLTNKAAVVDYDIRLAPNNSLSVVNDGKITNSITKTNLFLEVNVEAMEITNLHIEKLEFFTDPDCTDLVDMRVLPGEKMNPNGLFCFTEYYAKIKYINSSNETNLVFEMTCIDPGVVITQVGSVSSPIFKVSVDDVTIRNISFSITINDGVEEAIKSSVNFYVNEDFGIWSEFGSNDAIITDSFIRDNSIYSCGHQVAEQISTGQPFNRDSVIIISNINQKVKRIVKYGILNAHGTLLKSLEFKSMCISSDGEKIIVVGDISVPQEMSFPVILILNKNLEIISSVIIKDFITGGSLNKVIITNDGLNIVVVGHTMYLNGIEKAFVAKMAFNFVSTKVANLKIIGEENYTCSLRDIVELSNGNFVAVGEGSFSNGSGLIVRLDSNLAILNSSSPNKVTDFKKITKDNNDNLYTYSENVAYGYRATKLFKFSSDLTLISSKEVVVDGFYIIVGCDIFFDTINNKLIFSLLAGEEFSGYHYEYYVMSFSDLLISDKLINTRSEIEISNISVGSTLIDNKGNIHVLLAASVFNHTHWMDEFTRSFGFASLKIPVNLFGETSLNLTNHSLKFGESELSLDVLGTIDLFDDVLTLAQDLVSHTDSLSTLTLEKLHVELPTDVDINQFHSVIRTRRYD